MNVKKVKRILLAIGVFVLMWSAGLIVSALIGALSQLFVPFGYALIVLGVIAFTAALAWIVASEFV